VTNEQRFERDLPSILADLYPMSAPDYRDDLVQRFAATRQRPAWAFPERWLPMSVITLARQTLRPIPWRTAGLLAALALLLIAAIVAFVVGSARDVPLPYGLARNGSVAFEDGGDIVLVDSVTGNRTVTIGGPAVDTSPIFSRDGTRLAFLRESGTGQQLMVADALGQGSRALSTQGFEDFGVMDWAPDGTAILANPEVSGTRSIAIIPTDGSTARLVDVGMAAQEPVWVPPLGDTILFRTPHPSGEAAGFSLWRVQADGSGLQQLVPPGGQEWDSLYFAASPDGSTVAYQLRDPVDGIQKIYVKPIAGGTPRPLAAIESAFLPGWSPDGSWIAFLSDNDAFYVVPVDGSVPPRLLTAGTATEGAIWTPDGRRLLIVMSPDRPLLYDPLSGASTPASWSSSGVTSWQRLAPNP